MSKRILLQLDSDLHPSSFDSVVAIDSGVDHLLRYGQVQVSGVVPLVHGAMFTRGGDDLRNTAIFVGGSNVEHAEKILTACRDAFFGPIRVSMMLDANGCNTTASAAVVAAGRHVSIQGAKAVVLGGTGPVGRRVSQLLAADGADVVLTSRSLERSGQACHEIIEKSGQTSIQPFAVDNHQAVASILGDAEIVIGCGAAGAELVNQETIQNISQLKVAIDLNAVPPAGIGGIEVTDKAKQLGNGVAYGAIGVGGLKMKTHKAAIKSLFESNERVLDAEEIYAIAKAIG